MKTFRANLKIPLIKLFIWYLIFGIVFWAFLGGLFTLLIYTPIYLIVAIVYAVNKLTVQITVDSGHYSKTYNYFLFKRTKTVQFADIVQFDLERGIIYKLKNGQIENMDNSSAIPSLETKLRDFGIPKKIVNRHQRDYLKTH
jgi:hypothetical protein